MNNYGYSSPVSTMNVGELYPGVGAWSTPVTDTNPGDSIPETESAAKPEPRTDILASGSAFHVPMIFAGMALAYVLLKVL